MTIYPVTWIIQCMEFETHQSQPLGVGLTMNYSLVAREIIREMRGAISQRQLSQDLGYTFNQVGKWEAGFTQVKWHEFLNLGKLKKKDFETDLVLLFSASRERIGDPIFLDAVSAKMGCKKFRKTSAVDLADVLGSLGSKSAMLFGFLSLFVDCKNLASLQVPYNIFLKNISVVLANPLSVYVNAALQVEAYKKRPVHSDAIVAEHATCTVQEVRSVLAQLLKQGVITTDGRKYFPSAFDFSFSGLPHPHLRGLTKYSTQLAAERYPDAPIAIDTRRVLTVARSSVRVKAFSKEASIKISELIVQFHNQMDEIVRQDQSAKDNVQVILVHSFASNLND